MARPSTPPVLSDLQNASSSAAQVKALRQIKNELIGHELRKRYWIGCGILHPLVGILKSYRGDEKRRPQQGAPSESVDQGDPAQVQAIIILGCLAQGGPEFVQPIYASGVAPLLLDLLSPVDSSSVIITQSLRTLNYFANALNLCNIDDIEYLKNAEGLVSLLYTERVLRSLAKIITDTARTETSYEHVTLVAGLISKTCRTEHQRQMLTDRSILDALASQLLPWIATTFLSAEGFPSIHPDPRSGKCARLPSILKAIEIIISHSRRRAQRLLEVPVVRSVFHRMDEQVHAAYEEFIAHLPISKRSSVCPPTTAACVESLLPLTPTPRPRNGQMSSGHAPLDSVKASKSPWNRSVSTAVEPYSSEGLKHVQEDESPLVPWLMHIIRSFDEMSGLMAASLLATLQRLQLVKVNRDASLALLIIPPLVRMLNKNLELSTNAVRLFERAPDECRGEIIQEEAPAVIAMLTDNNDRTQKAAIDAGVIKKLASLLKETFDPASTSLSTMWSPEPPLDGMMAERDDKSSCMGAAGLSPKEHHILRLRETSLIALAALASNVDEYRKMIIDTGVLPFIIRTMRAEPLKYKSQTNTAIVKGELTDRSICPVNYKDSVVAACGAVRTLSRSPQALRTSLMDAGLPEPLFELLKSQDPDIRVQALAVVSNLLKDPSPLREPLLEGGIVATLCRNVHSDHLASRLNSLWGLKHLMSTDEVGLQLDCYQGLGGGSFLKQLINYTGVIPSESQFDEGNLTPIRMSTPNAAGERVDLLNAVDDDSPASSQIPEDGDEDLNMSDSTHALGEIESGLKAHTTSSQQHRVSRSSKAPNTPLHHFSDAPDEFAIVKQGLDIIRNFMLLPNRPENVDQILLDMGQDDFFRILMAKLRPRGLTGFARDRRQAEGTGLGAHHPQLEIIVSVLYILVHIAASDPRHRNMLISQPKVLELVMPYLGHPDHAIRVPALWIVINLTVMDDSSDRSACRDRIRRLNEMGFYDRIRQMDQDPSQDAKERASTAMQLSTALRN